MWCFLAKYCEGRMETVRDILVFWKDPVPQFLSGWTVVASRRPDGMGPALNGFLDTSWDWKSGNESISSCSRARYLI